MSMGSVKKIKVVKREEDGESHATKHILEVRNQIDENETDCNIIKI